jgi:SAM-dependent methyltransferase
MKIHKRYTLAQQVEAMEALGQLGGAENLEDDIALCKLQTIEPYFRTYLPKQLKILEAGAGRGRWVFYLRRLGYDVVGIDLASSDIEFAKRFDPHVPIVHRDVLDTGFPDSYFGAVISLGVVEHFEEGPEKAFAEVLRILEDGGFFLVTVPTQNVGRVLVFNRLKNLQAWLRRVQGKRLAFEEYRYSRAQFGRLLRASGFEIVDTAPDDFLPPKNMGLYTDSRIFQHGERKWELNAIGRVINTLERAISPWLNCSGTLWVCRKPARSHADLSSRP